MTEDLSTVLMQRAEVAGVAKVVEDVARRHGVAISKMLSRSHLAPYVAARRELCVELRARKMSYPQIGWILDRDHSTIITSVKRATNRRPASATGEYMRCDEGGVASCVRQVLPRAMGLGVA